MAKVSPLIKNPDQKIKVEEMFLSLGEALFPPLKTIRLTAEAGKKIADIVSKTPPDVHVATIPEPSSYKPLIDLYAQRVASLQKTARQLQEQQKGLVQRIAGVIRQGRSADEIYQQKLQELGVQEDLAIASGLIDEIRKLREEASQLLKERDDMIARIQERAITQPVFSRQAEVVERRFNARVNALTGLAKAKAATLEALMGRVNTARILARDAVNSFLAQKEEELNALKSIYSQQADLLETLTTEERRALEQLIRQKESEIEQDRRERQRVLELMVQYPKANIPPTASLEEATQIVRNYLSSQPDLYTQQIGGFEVLRDQSGKVLRSRAIGELEQKPLKQSARNEIIRLLYDTADKYGIYSTDVVRLKSKYPDAVSELERIARERTPSIPLAWEMLIDSMTEEELKSVLKKAGFDDEKSQIFIARRLGGLVRKFDEKAAKDFIKSQIEYEIIKKIRQGEPVWQVYEEVAEEYGIPARQIVEQISKQKLQQEIIKELQSDK